LNLKHGLLLLEISGSIEAAFWPRDAEASANSDASASCYGSTEKCPRPCGIETPQDTAAETQKYSSFQLGQFEYNQDGGGGAGGVGPVGVVLSRCFGERSSSLLC
jgi:hypothetical protein